LARGLGGDGGAPHPARPARGANIFPEESEPRAEEARVSRSLLVGADIGGTFTDLVFLDEEGTLQTRKVYVIRTFWTTSAYNQETHELFPWRLATMVFRFSCFLLSSVSRLIFYRAERAAQFRRCVSLGIREG
jgi:hypothetical protein